MYFVSLFVLSTFRPPPLLDPSALPSHHLLEDLPLELSSSGTVLTAILGIGERLGWNLSPQTPVSSESGMSPKESVSVAGVNSVKDELELGAANSGDAARLSTDGAVSDS